jgi:hypothetical protein
MVDRATNEDDHPEFAKDAYWDIVVPDELPYTPESYAIERHHQHHPLSSAKAAETFNAGVDGIFDDLPVSRSHSVGDDAGTGHQHGTYLSFPWYTPLIM